MCLLSAASSASASSQALVANCALIATPAVGSVLIRIQACHNRKHRSCNAHTVSLDEVDKEGEFAIDSPENSRAYCASCECQIQGDRASTHVGRVGNKQIRSMNSMGCSIRYMAGGGNHGTPT